MMLVAGKNMPVAIELKAVYHQRLVWCSQMPRLANNRLAPGHNGLDEGERPHVTINDNTAKGLNNIERCLTTWIPHVVTLSVIYYCFRQQQLLPHQTLYYKRR